MYLIWVRRVGAAGCPLIAVPGGTWGVLLDDGIEMAFMGIGLGIGLGIWSVRCSAVGSRVGYVECEVLCSG